MQADTNTTKALKLQDTISKRAPQNGIYKIYEILESKKYDSVIEWGKNGQFFNVKNPKKLEEQILPLYFSHKKFTSFSRLLNLYGFKRGKEDSKNYFFWHKNFIKGREDLLELITRRENEEVSKEMEIERWRFMDIYSNIQKKGSEGEHVVKRGSQIIKNGKEQSTHNLKKIKSGVENLLGFLNGYLQSGRSKVASGRDQLRFKRTIELFAELEGDTQEQQKLKEQETNSISDDLDTELEEAYLGKRPFDQFFSSYEGSLLDFESRDQELVESLFEGGYSFGDMGMRGGDELTI